MNRSRWMRVGGASRALVAFLLLLPATATAQEGDGEESFEDEILISGRLTTRDGDDLKDGVLRLGTSWGPLDVAGNVYLQSNYDMGGVLEGLRWNVFFEAYDSHLLEIDFDDEGVSYRFAGTFIQSSTGFVWAVNRKIELGLNLISGLDEEGDAFFRTSFKFDANF